MERFIAEAREGIALAQPVVAGIEHNAEVVRRGIEEGSAEIVEQAAQIRDEVDLSLTRVLAERSGFAPRVREMSGKAQADAAE